MMTPLKPGASHIMFFFFFSGNLTSLQLTRARCCAAWQEEHCSVAISFTALPGFVPLYVKSKAAELFRMLFYIQ